MGFGTIPPLMRESKRTPVQAWVVILSLSAATLIAFMVLLLLGVLRIPPTDVVSADETLVLYLLTAFNFVAFSVFAFILARILLRLARERRAHRLGAIPGPVSATLTRTRPRSGT